MTNEISIRRSEPRVGRPLNEDRPDIRLLRELSDVVAEMHASLSLHEVLQILTDRARTIVGVEVASATQAIEGDRSPHISAIARSRDAERAARTAPDPEGEGPWQDVRRSNEAIRLSPTAGGDTSGWRVLATQPAGRRPRTGWLGAPLVGPDGRNIGVVQLIDRSDGRPFSAADEVILVQLARMASVAVENARLYRAAVEARARLGWAAHVERVRAAELRAVIEGIGEGILLFDDAGEMTLSNPAAEAMLAEPPVRSLADLEARAGGQGDASSPVQARLSSDPERWVEIRTYPVAASSDRDGSASGGRIAVLRDVTEARRERAAREAFLGILSHELRTPITTIYAGSKVLARDERIPAATRRELAADVSAEAERLFRVVEDLLVMTRFERGALVLDREPVLLQRVVAGAIRTEQGNWPATRFVRRGPTDLPTVGGDAPYVEQIVRNLLSNAGRYSPSGSDVEVVLGDEAEGVSVRVLDRGPGFAGRDEGDALFELGSRAPATAAHAAGAGIGLFVCRRLVHAMGGEIWALQRDGGGAEFGFVLPRYEAA